MTFAKVASPMTHTRITDGPARLTSPDDLRRWSLRCHAAGMTVGLVPTMGALHRGHMSLVTRARRECDRVVVSIFVNPAQFGPGEDFDRYPRALESDLRLLTDAGVHAVFLPPVEAMYASGRATGVRVRGPLGELFEAAARPGHFDGVALVVTKLLFAARPDRAYFGQKDAQQCAVVRRLARDLDTGVQITICPTVRDEDGLALSSRNVYLSAEERNRALAIPEGLRAAARLFDQGQRRVETLIKAVREPLDRAGMRVDYIAVVDPETFSAVEIAAVESEILVAARINATRLIDVLRLGRDAAPRVSGSDIT